jgi:hypothetical protein
MALCNQICNNEDIKQSRRLEFLCEEIRSNHWQLMVEQVPRLLMVGNDTQVAIRVQSRSVLGLPIHSMSYFALAWSLNFLHLAFTSKAGLHPQF